MAISKVVLNGTTLMDATTATAAAEDITAPKTAMLADGVMTTGTRSGGGGSAWSRPAEWPDYSKLPDLVANNIEAEFFTYDNREAAWGIETLVGLYAKCSVTTAGVIKVDQVQIESNGSVTVLDTAIYNQNANIKFSVPLDAGDYVCYRLTPVSGHITGIAMANPTGVLAANRPYQRCIERYGNLPYCTGFHGWGSADRGWGCVNLISDTILSMASEVTEIDYSFSTALENLPMDGWTTVKNSNFRNCNQLKSIDFSKLDFSAVTNMSYKFAAIGLVGDIDMSGFDLSACTNFGYVFGSTGGGSRNMRTFRSPTGMNNITNVTDCLNGSTSLQVVEMDESFSRSSAGIGSRFCPSKQVKVFILRGESICPLAATNNLGFLFVGGGYVYVPEAVISDYKAATNWSTVADYILPIEGSYWETHHSDGSLIE